MNKSLIYILLLLTHLTSGAQMTRECVQAATDRQCYIVGEHMKVNVSVCLPDSTPSPSRVAYVEIADTAQLYTQAMLALDGGRGYGEIPLPDTMHSGTYQLCVYTRGLRNFGESAFFTTQIGVINPVTLSPKDNIRFLPAADDGSITAMLDTIPDSGHRDTTPPAEFPFAYELEGHIVTAHVATDTEDIGNVRLALVGKSTLIYDGREAGNGNYDFYTSDIYGDQPSLVCAYSNEGASLPTEILSPYARILPSRLPQLTVRCSEEALKQRYAGALRQKTIDEWENKDSQPRSVIFMGSTPLYIYDLDEWTSMNSVREMLTEFIRGVHARRNKGIQQLYIDSKWPALVLFDGIPIYDVQKFLEYDPRLLKYVQIYDDRYTFGQTYCHGVVSFISRSGKLPNFTLDEGSTFVSYQFPQPYRGAAK